MRLFVALNLPGAVKAQVVSASAGLRSADLPWGSSVLLAARR